MDDYHVRQLKNVYRSTEVFVEWIGERKLEAQNITVLDMACGAGANALYIANRYKNIQVVGIDIDKDLIDYGNAYLKQNSKYNNCKLCEGDWFNLASELTNTFDGIISFQTLSWLPDYHDALDKLAKLNPKWIAISSLFYEGDIDYTIKLKNYYRPTDGKEYEEMYYNIYSLIRIQRFFRELGYGKFEYMPYEIDIDLPKSDNKDIGTYTVKIEEGHRIQISAGLMMPWYFVIASK